MQKKLKTLNTTGKILKTVNITCIVYETCCGISKKKLPQASM